MDAHRLAAEQGAFVNATRLSAIARFCLKYRKAGILTGVALDDPLFADIDTSTVDAGKPG